MKNKVLPPTYFYLFFILSVLLHFVFPLKKVVFAPYSYFGILVFAIGIWINLGAWKLFRERKTTQNPYKIPSVLEKRGIFKVTRNPMYLGMFLNLLGLSIFLGTIITFIFPILFVIIMNWVYIPMEESNMEK